MVEVTSLNGQKMVINGDQIERIEACPDTIVSLTSGRKLIVRESVVDLVRSLGQYHRRMFEDCLPWPMSAVGGGSSSLLHESI